MNATMLKIAVPYVALAAGLAVAADRFLGPSALATVVHWVLFAAGSVVPLTLLARLVRREKDSQDAALRALELLVQCDLQRLGEATYDPTFTAPPVDACAADALSKLRARLVTVGERLQDLQEQRAAIESRARRFETQAQRMQSVLTGLSEPVIAIDKYDDLILTNASAEALFAIDSGKTEKRTLARLVRCEKLVELLTDTRRRRAPASAPAKSRWPIATARRTGTASPRERAGRRWNGSRRGGGGAARHQRSESPAAAQRRVRLGCEP